VSVRLTKAQQRTLDKMSPGQAYCAYELGESLRRFGKKGVFRGACWPGGHILTQNRNSVCAEANGGDLTNGQTMV